MIDDVLDSQVSELPMVLRAMIDFDQNGNNGGGVALMNPVDQFSSRFRSRLHPKGMLQPPSPNPSEYISSSSPRSTYGIGELNRRITDLKVDHPALSPPHNFMRDSSPKLLELGQNYPSNAHYQPTTLQFNHQLNQQIRRDSNNSTTSSSYYSMKSCDVSRRSSNQSHTSSISTLRPSSNASLAAGSIVGANSYNNANNFDSNQFYDPISAGSSRRSSQLSTADGIGNNNYGPPSSQLLSSHLARLQRHTNAPSHQYNSGAASFYQHNHPYNSYNYQASSQGVGNMNNNSMFYNYPVHPNAHNFSHLYANQNNNNRQQHHQTPSSSTDRRMSEPISTTASRNVQNDFTCPIVQRPRSTTPTKSLEMLLDSPSKETTSSPTAAVIPSTPEKTVEKENSNSGRNGSKGNNKSKNSSNNNKNSPSKPHPNETVVLDVLKTNEKIENCDELVIPDDMVLYLNQVSDDTTPQSAATASAVPKIKLDLDEIIEPMSSSISIEKIKEEDLLTLLAEVDAKSNVNEEQCDMTNNADGSDIQTFNEATVNDFEINNNSQDECKVEGETTTNVSKQVTCKS